MTEVHGIGAGLYSYLAEKFYGSRAIHQVWALIMSPKDIEITYNGITYSNVKW